MICKSINNKANISFQQKGTKDDIIKIIGFHPGLSCAQITKIIRRTKNKQITQQAVFKVLKQLVQEEIIIKKEKTYSLNISWIKEMQKMLKQMEENCEKESGKILLII